jgi:hypothetical protein
MHNLRHQLQQLQDNYDQQRSGLEDRIVKQRHELRQRHQLGSPTKRCHNRLQRHRKELADCKVRFQKRQRHLLLRLHRHRTRSCQLRRQLAERTAARDAIDTETLCRERHLEKDQIMLNLQVLLGNLHDWVKTHYFAPDWQQLSLERATQMIYREPGVASPGIRTALRSFWTLTPITTSNERWRPLASDSTPPTCAGGMVVCCASLCGGQTSSSYVVVKVLFKPNVISTIVWPGRSSH